MMHADAQRVSLLFRIDSITAEAVFPVDEESFAGANHGAPSSIELHGAM
jgi:hypothetical protein